MTPAILFESEGYVLDGPRLMGRQSAGNGFLRAAVAGHAGEPIYGTSPTLQSRDAFHKLVLSMDSQARPEWIPGQRLDLLARRGILYRPDQVLGGSARLRLRQGPASYSLCGVTHTLATSGTLHALADLQVAPVGPWDALICTSEAAVRVVETVLQAQADYLAWRLNANQTDLLPQLPVIPLGVHCEDFASSPAARAEARRTLDVSEDEVVVLFAGRLSVAGKAHPIPTYRALETVAQATGRKLAILHAGKFFNRATEEAYHSALVQFCPSVRPIFVDGGNFAAYGDAWRASDLFITLADSIQETFGLTPVEAMAAGLPTLVSDWNGYRDTVRDGLDGFRISTWAPGQGGDLFSLNYELQSLVGAGYDTYLSQTSTAVALDVAMLVDRLTRLVDDKDLRLQHGASGQARARATFDWSVVYRRYQALWAELDIRRDAARRERGGWLSAAPRVQPAALGGFRTFASYPTELIQPATMVHVRTGAGLAAFQSTTSHQLFALWNPPTDQVAAVLESLAAGPLSVQALADKLRLPPIQVCELVARLSKLDLLSFSAS